MGWRGGCYKSTKWEKKCPPKKWEEPKKEWCEPKHYEKHCW